MDKSDDCDVDVDTHKYQVWHEVKKRDRAHLSDDGKHTFCGIQFWHNGGWCIEPNATLAEFVKDVRPRCASCLRNAKTVLAINGFSKLLTE